MGQVTEAYEARVASGDFSADLAQVTVLPALDRVATTLRSAPPRRVFGRVLKRTPEFTTGIYLWGGVGRGKSMLMDLLHEVAGGGQSRRIHFHAFMQEVQGRLHDARKTQVDDALIPVAAAMSDGLRLLCLDEMQISDIADAMIVGRFFEQLLDAGVVVVTTSNLLPDDLYKDGLNRALFLPFIELIKTRLSVIELASPRDYRQDRLEGEQVYFHPADASARAAVERLWSGFFHRGAESLVLSVKGRKVEIPQFANGVARARFPDLCGQPLGPADYLAIADAVRVLILEEIPYFSSENANETRRFVTLIDALYEARVRLIATAANAPERLQVEGSGAFEFERTASRLREMQSAEWCLD
ncbi:MAG: AFG1 family ATPase [Boseongicola sp. SB0665_bin_10]|nr:AFG1 family ATPase [Boseongicola sp. SB0665_bin_10]